jgi:transposase
LALLVTQHYQIPLLHHVYEGNIPDVTLFPRISSQLIERYHQLTTKTPEATLVFDKGNVSEDVMEHLLVNGVHFVAALPVNRLPEVLRTPQEHYEEIPSMPGTKALSTPVSIWGTTCNAVVAYSESFFTQQLSAVTHYMVKTQAKLAALQQRLNSWQNGKKRGKKPTMKAAKAEINKILGPQFMDSIFRFNLTKQNDLPSLTYSVDHNALRELTEHRLGKTILITDHLDWVPQHVINAYRNLSRIEETFKHMKNVRFLRWQPAYHWTDQKLRVHAFYCVLALLLASLAHKEVRQAHIEISLPHLLKELCAIKEVALIYPPGAGQKSHVTLSRMSPRQKKLSTILGVQDILFQG